jgi:hypothetical protein
MQAEQKQQHAADQVEMGVRRCERKVWRTPMAMPASIPNSRATTLTHIISDLIIGLSLFGFAG